MHLSFDNFFHYITVGKNIKCLWVNYTFPSTTTHLQIASYHEVATVTHTLISYQLLAKKKKHVISQVC
jgi:cytochrome bd-type quinol oxidase subunit 1